MILVHTKLFNKKLQKKTLNFHYSTVYTAEHTQVTHTMSSCMILKERQNENSCHQENINLFKDIGVKRMWNLDCMVTCGVQGGAHYNYQVINYTDIQTLS